MDTVDLEELRDSHERTGAPVLWLSCEGQIDVWELFSDNSYVSAILDRQGLLGAAPTELRKLRASHRHCRAFGRRSRKSEDRCNVPDCCQKPE